MNDLIAQQPMLPTLGEFSPTSWTAPVDMTFEQWEAVGETLQYMQGAINWWVGDWLNVGERKWGEEYAQAIEETGWKYQDLANCKWVAGKVEFSTRVEKLSWSHHREVANLSPNEQAYWLDLAALNNWSVIDLQKARSVPTKTTITLPPTGQYRVIYADPPWRYEHSKTDSRKIENQYPTLPLEEICALPIADLAADDAILFLWATSPKLAESMQVIDSWGFIYRTCMVWVKDKIGMGYYARQQHELLLIAKRGDMPAPLPEDRQSSVVLAPRTGHSKKPQEFYEVIERMYPDQPRIELFARKERDGWTAWGNEL